jgi:two-component SAPR family response regulator
MFHVIAVDDEDTALKWFHRIATENKNIMIEREFLYPKDAIVFVKKHPVDVAFLDIEMPEMDGLELAERLMEIDPFIKVIFVTAYNQYALDAFRTHAIGYLLKPLDSAEFAEQIDFLADRYVQRPIINPNKRLYVKCFGQFSVGADSEGHSSIRWKTAKAEELFALLIHHQGRIRSRESLIETLWPELDSQRSANLFRVTCTYIRTALADLGFSNMLLRELDGYKLNTNFIDCDLFHFNNHSKSSQGMGNLESIAALYSGEYLEGKSYDWATATRTQLESDFKKLQHNLAYEYLDKGLYDKACVAMEKILQFDPYKEDAMICLIQAQLQAGDRAAAIKAYKSYAKILKDDLGILPSEKFKQLIPFHIN